MTGSFAHQLRAQPRPIRLGDGAGETVSIRVEVPEVWDTVQVEASPDEPVRAVKIHALERLQPDARAHDAYVVKFRGWEILDESVALRDIGARDGAILLVTHRRRRQVR